MDKRWTREWTKRRRIRWKNGLLGPWSLYIFRRGTKTSNRTFAKASEAGDHISSPQRQAVGKIAEKRPKPQRGGINKHESDLQSSIRNQEEHHRKYNYQEEFLALLRKHEVEYDERYVWD